MKSFLSILVSEHGMEGDVEMDAINEEVIDDIHLQTDLASDINDLLEWAKTLKKYSDEVSCIIQKIRYIQDETVSMFIRCLKQRLITQGCQVTGEILFWFLLGIFENEEYVDRGKYLRIIATNKQDEWMAESIIHKFVSRSELQHEIRCRELIHKIPGNSIHLFLYKYLIKANDEKVMPKEKIEFLLETFQNLKDSVSDICLAKLEESNIYEWPFIIKWYENIQSLKDLPFLWKEDSNLFDAAYYTNQLANRHGNSFIDKIYQCLKLYHIEETLFLSAIKGLYTGSLTISLREIDKVHSSKDANLIFGDRNPCYDDRKRECILSIMKSSGNTSLTDDNYDLLENILTDVDKISSQPSVLQWSEQKYKETFLSTLTESDIKEWSNKCKEILISNPTRFDELLPEMVVVIDRAINLKRQYCLRDTQKVSIIAFLSKLNKSEKGKLQQIATGEGKTLIIVAFSIIKVLSNKKVDIITSSSVLAKRDSRINQDVFNLFNVTVSNNCSESINDRRGAYSSDVVYGEIGSFQRDILITEFYDNNIIGGRNRINIVVDEVDSMLLDRGENVLYLSHEIAGIDAIEFVFVYIWSFVNAKNMIGTDEDRRSVRRCILDAIYGIISNEDILKCLPVGSNINVSEIWEILTTKGIVDKEGRLLTRSLANFELEKYDIDILRNTNLTGNLINMLKDTVRKGKLIEVPRFLEEFINRHLDEWIKNAFQAKYMKEGKDFMIDIDRTESSRGEDVNIVIMDNKTGQELYSMQWNCGLHQFLQLKHKCAISSESLKAVFMSNISFFRLYENLYGLSGTMGSQKERDMLREMYNTSFITIPTFKEPRFVEHDTIVCTSTDGWLKSISETAIPLSKKRPVLIICETIHSCCKIEKEFKRRNVNTYVYKNSYCELNVLDNELNTGCIIIATNLAGRGTDIKINGVIDSHGGLHVILSYLPSNLRIEEQAFGRAARKGQKGSGQLIIFNNLNSKYRIKDVFTVSSLKVERDASENKRISQIQERYENFIQVEENLFKQFQKFYNVLRRTLNKQRKHKEFHQVILQASLDRWAFWLDSAEKSLKHLGTHSVINDRLRKFLREINVSGVQHDSEQMMLMLQSPSQLVKAGKAKMLTKNYGMAQTFFEYVINNYPSFSESALYYKAYCLLKRGSHGQDFAIVKRALEHCTCLLHQREEDIKNEVQIINFISSNYDDRRDSFTLSNGFQQQKDNAMQIFYQILDSIDNIIGHTIDPNMLIDTTCNIFHANMIFNDLVTDHILSPQKVRTFPLDDNSWNSINACYESYYPEIRSRIELLKEKSHVYINDFADILPSREEFWRILIEIGILIDQKEYILVHKGEMHRCNNFLPKFVIDSLQSLISNKKKLYSKECIFLYTEQREKVIAQTAIMVPLKTFKKIVGYSFILNILQKEKIISQCSVASLSLNINCWVSQVTLSKFDHIDLKSFIEIGVTEDISCQIFNQLVQLKVISRKGKLLIQELGNVWLCPLSKYTTEVRNVLTKCFKYRLCLLYLLREKDLPLDLLSQTHEMLFRDLVDSYIITSAKITSDTAKKRKNEKHEVIYNFDNKTNQFPRILEFELTDMCIDADFSAEELKQKLIQYGICKKSKETSEGCLEIIVKYETLTTMLEGKKLKDLGNEVTCFITNRMHNSFNISSILIHLEKWKAGIYKFENTDAELKSVAECLTEEDQTVLYKNILTMTNNGFGDIIVLVERKWTPKTVFKIFCILSIGFVQVGIAIAVEFYSIGAGTFIANALLSEGIGDIMFAVECMISGHCTIQSYSHHKKLSLALRAVTGGVACIVARGAEFSRFGYKIGGQFFQGHSGKELIQAGVSKTLLAKTITKYIGKKFVDVTSMRIIDKGIDNYIENILRRCLVELVEIKKNTIVSTDKHKELKEIIASLARKLGRQSAVIIVEKCMDKCLLFRESDSSAVLVRFNEITHAFGNGLREGLKKLQKTGYSIDNWLHHTVTICDLLAKGIEVTKAGIAIQSFRTSILDCFEHEIKTALSFRVDIEDGHDEGELEEGWASEQLNNIVKKANSKINKNFEMQMESIIIKPLFQLVGSKISKQVYKRVCQLYNNRRDLCQRRTFDCLKKEIGSEMKHISAEIEDEVKIEYSKKILKLLKETRNPCLFADIVEEGIPIDIHSVQAVAEITGVNIVIETIGADSVTMPQKFTPYGNQRGEELITIQLKYHFNTQTGASHFETVSTSENQFHTSKCLLEAVMKLTGKIIDRKVLSETIRTHPDICRNIKRGLHEFFNFKSDINCVLTKNPEPSEIIEKGHLLSNCKQMRDGKIVMELHKRNMSVTFKNKKMIWKELISYPSSEELKIQNQIKHLESFFRSSAQKPKRSQDCENGSELLNVSLHVNEIADTCIDTSWNYLSPTKIYFGNNLEYVDNLQVFFNCRIDTRFVLSNNRGMILGHPNALHIKSKTHLTRDTFFSNQQLAFKFHHMGILIGGKRQFPRLSNNKEWEDKGDHLFSILNGLHKHVKRLPTKKQLQRIDLSNWKSGLGHDLAIHDEKETFLNGIEKEKYKFCVVAEHLIISNKKAYNSVSDKTSQMQQLKRGFREIQKTLIIDEGIKKKIKDTVKKANSLKQVGNIMKTSVPNLISSEITEP